MIWKKFLRDNWWKALGLFVLLEAHLVISVMFYPDFKKNFEMLTQIAFAKVPVVQDLLQMTGTGGYPGYYLIQHFFKALNVLGSVGCVILGMGVVAREAENRTIEILLSRPISRTKILIESFLVGAVLIFAIVFLSALSGIWFSVWIEEELPLATILLCSAQSAAFLILLFAITIWVSTLCSEQSKVVFGTAGVFVLMFLLYFVKGINKLSLYQLNDLSLFLDIHRTQGLPILEFSIVIAATAFFFFLARLQFQKRDF